MEAHKPERTGSILAGLLAIAGSIIFIYGGSFHPHVSSAIGTPGTEAFYLRFIAVINHTAHWERFHTMILAGPMLWALSIPGMASIQLRNKPVWQIAAHAFSIGAALWAATFVFDGFVSSLNARAFQSTADTTLRAMIYRDFIVNQKAVAHFGGVSWFTINFGIAIISILTALRFRTAPKRAIVGILGIALAAWSIISSFNGEFAPAPFTSEYWTLTALATAAWFSLLGASLLFTKPEAPGVAQG